MKTAIQNRDMKTLKKLIKEAVKTYKDSLKNAIDNDEVVTSAGKPQEATVDTVHGEIPLSMVFDEDSKWDVITGAYVGVLSEVAEYQKSNPSQEELHNFVAKTIATNSVFRTLASKSKKVSKFL